MHLSGFKLTDRQITGITGYIGFQTLVLALERGYAVRGVVRSDASIVDLCLSLQINCIDKARQK